MVGRMPEDQQLGGVNTGLSLPSERGGGEPCLGHAPWESGLVRA